MDGDTGDESMEWGDTQSSSLVIHGRRTTGRGAITRRYTNQRRMGHHRLTPLMRRFTEHEGLCC